MACGDGGGVADCTLGLLTKGVWFVNVPNYVCKRSKRCQTKSIQAYVQVEHDKFVGRHVLFVKSRNKKKECAHFPFFRAVVSKFHLNL
ncbi:hypothetical protein CEXT_660861 [Caerostris extrusa]|uniref:Uncharacterized protein n=1 Tax=Caerostris extrusa TaxID=172846 RepID=A0AAV4MVT1_CAEEX|nr:hypothetical protein CEXT_660861 [Caerostris extrusa]